MLYGMDDEDFEEEFDLIETKHINVKKVIIAIVIGIAVIAFIIAAIIISFNLTTKKVDIVVKEVSENEIETEEIKEENQAQESQKDEKNEEEAAVAEEENKIAEEIKVAPHDIAKLSERPLPVFNENGVQEIKDIYLSEEKQVYLTFDDGPSKDITPKILDILNHYNVKATFFVLGARVELYPETLKREFDEGHYIANHGYSHIYSKIYTNRDTVFEEYAQTEQCIKTALNNPDFNTYLFRFPGGSSGGRYERIKAEARELFNSYGIAFTNWNCLTGDAENKTTAEACINEMLRTKGNQNSIILLMHDANDKQQTVDALPGIIEYFMNEGYTFKNFYEIFKEK